MEKRNLLGRFLIWRVKHMHHRYYMMLLSVLVGLGVGIAAAIIKNSVFAIEWLLTFSFSGEYHKFLFFVYPIIGIFLVIVFVKYLLKQHVGHGIPSVLYAISKNSGKIKSHNLFSSIVSSAFTVGFGGSVGLEGPTVATGAAIGSNVGRVFRLNYKQVILLLGCACAGAMAAIFKAPIAAIVFALEVIMLDLTMASLVPLLMASVTAALTSYLILGTEVLYPFQLEKSFELVNIPYYIVFGIVSGFVSIYFTRIYIWIGKLFDKIKKQRTKLIIGGAALGVLLFSFPVLYGEGYQSINMCLKGETAYLFNNTLFQDYSNSFWILIAVLTAIILLKIVATAITFGAGGIGGIFAPTLFMGANLGLLFALLMNQTGVHDIPISNFALVGMGGMIAGVLHAPLTAIFLIAEITTGYGLFMPLMIVATISYITIKIFESNSVYTYQLAKRGELMTHDKDKAVLSLMKVDKLIEKNFLTVKEDFTLRQLVDVIAKSSRNVFPVIDDQNNFIGLVVLDQIRHIMFNHDFYDNTNVTDLMYIPRVTVSSYDSMEEVAEKFQATGNYNIPVIDDGKYVGFVSRANVFSTYRRMLKHFSED